MKREHLDALLLLASFDVLSIEELPNQYWPETPDYADIRKASPWWRVQVSGGSILLGWRKRVIHIDWTDTKVRRPVTGPDDTTSGDHYCHAWSYSDAVRYLSKLRRAMGNLR